jgi:hypothetical protein
LTNRRRAAQHMWEIHTTNVGTSSMIVGTPLLRSIVGRVLLGGLETGAMPTFWGVQHQTRSPLLRFARPLNCMYITLNDIGHCCDFHRRGCLPRSLGPAGHGTASGCEPSFSSERASICSPLKPRAGNSPVVSKRSKCVLAQRG